MVDKRIGKKISGSFCVLPWVHRFTNIGGEIQVCCSSEEYHRAILDDTGREMNVSEIQDDEKIMNSKFMKHVRQQMLQGKWPSLCKRCHLSEDNGGNSRRQFENERYEDVIEQVVANTEGDGTLKKVEIMSSDFRLGNLCNLACRMCNPRSSSRWLADWKAVNQARFHFDDEAMKEYQGYDWYKNPDLWAKFKIQIPFLRHLHFAGGEPLINKQMVELLKVCVDMGYSKQIELTYNTNITLIPEEVKKLWPHFRIVRLLCSVDGFGPLNEFIRHPSKWSVIDRHLREFEDRFEELGLREVLLMCTVQAYNILHLEPLYDYLASGFKKVTPLPQLINLHYPDYYRTQMLPPELKKEASLRIARIKSKVQARFDAGLIHKKLYHLTDALDEAANFMNLEDRQELIPEFLSAAKSIDTLRNQSLYETVPELAYLKMAMLLPDTSLPKKRKSNLSP